MRISNALFAIICAELLFMPTYVYCRYKFAVVTLRTFTFSAVRIATGFLTKILYESFLSFQENLK